MTPDNGLGVSVCVEVLFEKLPWEWVQLLNTGDSSVLNVIVGAMLMKSSVDLSTTENDALNLLWLVNSLAVLGIWDDPFELRVTSELLNWRSGNRMTEQRLGEEDDEG